MEIFNAPNRETCTVRRERTNTPLQALVTLNDPQFVEAARHLAERALKEGGDDADGRLDFMARRLLARPLRAGGGDGRRRRRSPTCSAHYQAHAGRREEADRRRRVEGRPDARRRRRWRRGRCWRTS